MNIGNNRTPNTVRIAAPKPLCRHPEHNPPGAMLFQPGTWQHTCPSCGEVTTFEVPEITL